MDISKITDKISEYMSALVKDGGPSITRWVFVRTAEIISFGWLVMVACACTYLMVGIFASKHMDGVCFGAFVGAIVTLGGGLFAFAQQTQNTKLALDSKASGIPSVTTTNPLSSKVESTGDGHDRSTQDNASLS